MTSKMQISLQKEGRTLAQGSLQCNDIVLIVFRSDEDEVFRDDEEFSNQYNGAITGTEMLSVFCFFRHYHFIRMSIVQEIYGIVGAVFNYFQTTKLQNIGEWPFNIRPIYLAFVVTQGLFPIVGFFGILAACFRRPIFLFGSGSFLLAIFTFCCVFGIVSYRVSSQQILESCYKTFRKNTNKSEILDWMNEVQWQHACCGIYSYKDWYIVGHQSTVDSKLPPTCCRQDLIPRNKDCADGIFSAAQSNSSHENMDIESRIYSRGCGSTLVNIRKELLDRLGLEMSICGAVSLFVALILYAGVTKFFSGRDNSCTSPTNYETGGNRLSPTGDAPGNAYAHDENNNITKYGSYDRGCRRGREKWPKKRHNSPFPSIHSRTRFGRSSSRSSTRGNLIASKSFILGDAPSTLLTPISEEKDSEVPQKNVDMIWYQSLDKNMSTLSTTPIDISSMLLPAMNLQNKKVTDEDAFLQAQRNTFTLVGEKTFTSSLSQNCGASLTNQNTMKPLDETEIGHSSPNCSNYMPNRLTTVATTVNNNNALVENDLDTTNRTESEGEDTANPSKQGELDKNEERPEAENISSIENDYTMSSEQMNSVTTTSLASQINSKYPNPITSVRSSTLATIQEESESAKGSPKSKGASPASGCLTPETVTPQPTQTELFPDIIKEENTVACAMEVHRENNNNDNFNKPLSTTVDVKADQQTLYFE